MKLPAEWEAIVLDVPNAMTIAREVVERCYTLANKPKKELSAVEICKAFEKGSGFPTSVDHAGESWMAGLRAVIAAHEVKQQEPEKVKFRAARRKGTDVVEVIPVLLFNADKYEWLEPEQSFEVVLP